ncbi:hypothetical protein GCM10010411_35620 [Actinomadura fulvescens]|uniref:Uncharacterized protein n=1 Tax=Actinomadura fulvescens TaxID=46160 RepID=A0ABP6C3D2_9ACTN
MLGLLSCGDDGQKGGGHTGFKAGRASTCRRGAGHHGGTQVVADRSSGMSPHVGGTHVGVGWWEAFQGRALAEADMAVCVPANNDTTVAVTMRVRRQEFRTSVPFIGRSQVA